MKDPTLDFCMSTILADSKDQSASYQNCLRLDLFEFCLHLLDDFKGLSLWSDSCYFDLVWKAGFSTRKCWRKSMFATTIITSCLLCQVANLRHLEKEKSEKSFVRKASKLLYWRVSKWKSLTVGSWIVSHWLLCWQGLDPCQRRHFQAFPTTWSTHFHLTACLPFLSQLQCRLFFSAAVGTEHQSETARICIQINTQKTPHTKLHGLTVYRQSNRQCFTLQQNALVTPSPICVETFEQEYNIKTEKIWTDTKCIWMLRTWKSWIWCVLLISYEVISHAEERRLEEYLLLDS